MITIPLVFLTVPEAAVWLAAGLGLGVFLATLQWHPGRSLGLVPWSATGLTVALALAAVGAVPLWWYLPIGLLTGLAVEPLFRRLIEPVDSAWKAYRVAGWIILPLAASALVLGLFGALWPGQALLLPEDLTSRPLVVLIALAAAAAWVVLYRQALEQLMEVIIWPIYRIQGRGPGLEQMPRSGPVIVLANHCAWFDPLWLGKVVPRRLVPMMTSGFYDIPGLRWLMRHVVRAIRVSNAPLRREVPELQEAVQALDAGGCLVIFPEGRMRRTAEKLLHPFGQGIWLILKERPRTPVVACWIEGGWGSFFSYFNGKPTKNKRFDFWRSIRIGACEPEILEKEVVEDRQTTRRYLMERCLAARQYLGLAALPVKEEQLCKAAEEFEEAS